MIVDVVKKSKKENPCLRLKSGPRCSSLHSAYIIAMQPMFRLFVCALLGWIKISCWALVSAYSINFFYKIAKWVSDKRKTPVFGHPCLMQELWAQSVVCPGLQPNTETFIPRSKRWKRIRVILKFITLNDIHIYETGKMLLGNIIP